MSLCCSMNWASKRWGGAAACIFPGGTVRAFISTILGLRMLPRPRPGICEILGKSGSAKPEMHRKCASTPGAWARAEASVLAGGGALQHLAERQDGGCSSARLAPHRAHRTPGRGLDEMPYGQAALRAER